MARVSRLLLALCGLLTISPLCACGQAIPAPRPVDEQVVFAVDGSGWLRGIADDLRQAVAELPQPLLVEPFAWSHGPGRILADLHGHVHQRTKGQELAETILGYRRIAPVGKVFIVCHSAGAAVVLAAAQQLPEGSVERIILLAPALAPGCDLRPALRCARCGVDSFHSQNDMIGGVVLAVMGNADGQFVSSAGSAGFTPGGDDAALYANLRQHPWDREMTKIGYYGGHFGCTRSSFLRTYVAPLLVQNTAE